MEPALQALTIQLLAWLEERPRTYAEVMDAWRTSCPRLPVWETAVADGLVQLLGAESGRQPAVGLTPRGRKFLSSVGCA